MVSNFAHRFKQALEERDLTMADISRMTKINKASLSQYINDVYTPKQDRIYLIAKVLNVSPSWLMGFDTSMERKEETNKEKKETIFKNEDFEILSSTRTLKEGATPFIGPYLDNMTVEIRPSREDMLYWLRENVRSAAFTGANYEDRDDESLYRLYKELRDEAERYRSDS